MSEPYDDWTGWSADFEPVWSEAWDPAARVLIRGEGVVQLREPALATLLTQGPEVEETPTWSSRA